MGHLQLGEELPLRVVSRRPHCLRRIAHGEVRLALVFSIPNGGKDTYLI